jgi:hypothetical protein
MRPSFTGCATVLVLSTSTASAEWMRNADGEIWVPLNVAPSRDIDAPTTPSDRAAPIPSVPGLEVGTTGSVAPPRAALVRPDFSELELRDRRSCEMQTYNG